MANARQGKAHSSYKRRCHLTITAPNGADGESELMQRFVTHMNRKMMLNTDTAWIIEAMFQRFLKEEAEGLASDEVAHDLAMQSKGRAAAVSSPVAVSLAEREVPAQLDEAPAVGVSVHSMPSGASSPEARGAVLDLDTARMALQQGDGEQVGDSGGGAVADKPNWKIM